MLIDAVIMYIILAILTGPFWPLALLGGRAGPLGYILVIIWLGLLIGGSVS